MGMEVTKKKRVKAMKTIKESLEQWMSTSEEAGYMISSYWPTSMVNDLVTENPGIIMSPTGTPIGAAVGPGINILPNNDPINETTSSAYMCEIAAIRAVPGEVNCLDVGKHYFKTPDHWITQGKILRLCPTHIEEAERLELEEE